MVIFVIYVKSRFSVSIMLIKFRLIIDYYVVLGTTEGEHEKKEFMFCHFYFVVC